MTTHRRKFLKSGLGAGAAAGALAFPSIATAQAPIQWKMTSAYAKGAYTSFHSACPPPS